MTEPDFNKAKVVSRDKVDSVYIQQDRSAKYRKIVSGGASFIPLKNGDTGYEIRSHLSNGETIRDTVRP